MEKKKKALVLKRETLCALDMAKVRGGTNTLICATNVCEPADPNTRYRLPKLPAQWTE